MSRILQLRQQSTLSYETVLTFTFHLFQLQEIALLLTLVLSPARREIDPLQTRLFLVRRPEHDLLNRLVHFDVVDLIVTIRSTVLIALDSRQFQIIIIVLHLLIRRVLNVLVQLA